MEGAPSDVDASLTVETTFSAGHQIEDLASCQRAHGHGYVIRVTFTGELDPKLGIPRGSLALHDELRVLANELEGRNLNDMLPGVVTSPIGIAAWAMERLQFHFSKVTEISVEQSGGVVGTVHRTIRTLQ